MSDYITDIDADGDLNTTLANFNTVCAANSATRRSRCGTARRDLARDRGETPSLEGGLWRVSADRHIGMGCSPHLASPQRGGILGARGIVIVPMSSLDVLLSSEAIAERVAVLAKQISEDFQDEPMLLVGVLKGSFHFLSDLSRRLKGDISIDFVQVSSYGSGKSSSGVVQIRKDLDVNIEGRNVLIVEDIVDTGTTLNHLRELLSTRKPKSLRVVSLLRKPEAQKVLAPVEYVGFDIPNEFVVGYGLDFDERYRNLPYIAILRE